MQFLGIIFQKKIGETILIIIYYTYSHCLFVCEEKNKIIKNNLLFYNIWDTYVMYILHENIKYKSEYMNPIENIDIAVLRPTYN
jgi:hypothetical protein